jgi:hypothetical protein
MSALQCRQLASPNSLTKPSVGAVYVYHYAGRTDRYIILDASPEGKNWRLNVVSVDTRRMYMRYRYNTDVENITFEPLADGEEVLFFQAMLAPHTLEGFKP